MRGHATTSVRLTAQRRALFSVTVLLLAVALSACTFTTDTAATVGGERITWGEVNAEARASRQSPAAALDYLIALRLTEIEARAQGITLTDSEVQAQIDADIADTTQQLAAQKSQIPATIAANAGQALRPIINANGGAGLTQADLSNLLTDEVTKMQGELDARGTLMASGVSQQFIQEHAISLRNALAGAGIALTPADLESTIAAMAQQLGGVFTAADAFPQNLAQQGFSSIASYRQYLRLRLLVDKMRSSWYQPTIDTATLQLLVTDSQARAVEATQKGRAGTSFDDLVKTYASLTYQDPQAINSLGSRPVDTLPQQLRTSFSSIQAGQYSQPITLQSGLVAVVYITKIERRAPTATEESSLANAWLQGLRAKYPVNITDPSLDTTTTP